MPGTRSDRARYQICQVVPGTTLGWGGWGRLFFLMILKTYPLFPNIRKNAGASFSKSAFASLFLQPTFIRGRKLPMLCCNISIQIVWSNMDPFGCMAPRPCRLARFPFRPPSVRLGRRQVNRNYKQTIHI